MSDNVNKEVKEAKKTTRKTTKTTDLNIYQKIAVLQENIKVNKDNYCEYSNFKYRSIQDILIAIKPQLKELNLIIKFGNGKLQPENDLYSLEMKVIDVNKPENNIIEYGEILFDREKRKMDLSQKVLSAKTFLKKSLLEDLLLINEDDDPDGHDNLPPKQPVSTPQPQPQQQSLRDRAAAATGQTPKQPKPQEPAPKQDNKKVTPGQLKRYFAIAKSKGFDVAWLDECIKLAYNLNVKEDWKMNDYKGFTDYMEKNDMTKTKSLLEIKITKQGKKVPKLQDENQ